MESALIIGAGNLGTALYLGLKKFLPGGLALCSNKPIPEKYTTWIEANHVYLSIDKEIIRSSDFIFICVQDRHITEVVTALCHYNLTGKKIVHTSGATDVSALDRLKTKGALTGSWHPVQTFKALFSEPDIWKGTVCTCTGDSGLKAGMKWITEHLGAEFLPVTSEQKKSIHLAAVVAANYQVALLAWANQILDEVNIPGETAKKLLTPLLEQILDNFKKRPVHSILTGPLVRGDSASVSSHLKILKESKDPESEKLYKALGLLILNDPNFIIPEKEQLKKLLDELC